MHSTATPPANPWVHRLAVLTSGMTLLLIFVGGVVTNTGSALAVPDWPTTFGYNMFLYPWSRMVGGIFYEHSHRLIGSVVGLLTVTFAVWLWLTESRRWVRTLGVVAVLAVVVQGILGGMRVVLLEHGLAIIHGCFAEAFLALMVSLAVCTGREWSAVQNVSYADASRVRLLALAAPPLVYLQIVFGALVTHTGSRIDAHLLFAALVTTVIALLAGRVLQRYVERSDLRRPALVLLMLLGVQLGLGFGAFAWRFTVLNAAMPANLGLLLQTTHRLTGAALWATTMVLSLRVLRLVGVRHAAPATAVGADRSLSEVLA